MPSKATPIAFQTELEHHLGSSLIKQYCGYFNEICFVFTSSLLSLPHVWKKEQWKTSTVASTQKTSSRKKIWTIISKNKMFWLGFFFTFMILKYISGTPLSIGFTKWQMWSYTYFPFLCVFSDFMRSCPPLFFYQWALKIAELFVILSYSCRQAKFFSNDVKYFIWPLIGGDFLAKALRRARRVWGEKTHLSYSTAVFLMNQRWLLIRELSL